MSGRRPPRPQSRGPHSRHRDAGPHPPGAATQPGPRSTLRGARRCAAGADPRGSLGKETRSDLATERGERPAGAEAGPRRLLGLRGARLQDRDAQRPCLEGSVFAPGHSPRLFSAFPDGCPASRARRRVAFSSRGGGGLYGLPQAESFGEPGAQGRVDTAGRRARRPLTPPSPPPSLRSWLRSRSCARALSLQSLCSGHSTRSGLCPEGQSITCPVLTDFRIREKAFIPSEFSPSLRAHGLKPLLNNVLIPVYYIYVEKRPNFLFDFPPSR